MRMNNFGTSIREKLIELRETPNSVYYAIKPEFLFHSNKIEGSTFSVKELSLLIDKNVVHGTHPLDDVIETRNSLDVFDYLVETLEEPITLSLIIDFHKLLKKDTKDEERGFAGTWKKIPNVISGSDVVLSQPWEVPFHLENLLDEWSSSGKEFGDIVRFHSRFEQIHPFQDGNGRIGRFLMLKQCLENNIVPIVVDEEYSIAYKEALEVAQTKGNFEKLMYIMELCQDRFRAKKWVGDFLKFLGID